jgi:hypothetical protein
VAGQRRSQDASGFFVELGMEIPDPHPTLGRLFRGRGRMEPFAEVAEAVLPNGICLPFARARFDRLSEV